MSDLISRQAAIEVLSLGKEILSRVLDDMDVVGTDRDKYSWGIGLIESNINDIEDLPSVQYEPSQVARDIATIIENEQDMRVIEKNAQAEIIRCKDCKFWTHIKRTNRYWCKTDDGLYDLNPSPNDFCSRAERRTDEQTVSE